MPVYPIGFSIHSSKVVEDVPEKKRLLSPLIPGNFSTYIYHNEEDYYTQYKDSYFATTHLKAGWDCMRHYEILACGCIPYFPNLEGCPPDTMTLFPKEIVLESNQIYKTLAKSADPVAMADELNLKDTYIKPLLEHTRKNLTNKAVVEYMLGCLDPERKIRRVLYLSGNTNPDYLRCLTLMGFKELFGTECHDYPRIPHLYRDYPEDRQRQLYGKGISYARVADPKTHKEEYDATVEEDIRQHRYDLVFYGSYHRGMPFWDQVNVAYEKKDIVLMCGEDLHSCSYRDYSDQGYTVFVREL
jgi:hypothetical protein